MIKKLKNVWRWLRADRKRLIGAVVILVLLAIGIGGAIFSGKNKLTYQTTAVEKGTIVSSISASGQILASNLINVSTQATGVVSAVYVKNGDYVSAGQKVAEITLDSDGALANAKAYASWVSAQVGFNNANNNYRQTQASLANVYDQLQGHATDETFAQKDQRTKAEVANDEAFDATKVASANLGAAGLAYRQVSPVIIAPNAGIVDNITVTPGMILSNSSTTTGTASSNRIAVVHWQGNPLATFNVSEVDVTRVLPGQKATITLDSIAGKTFTGKVMTVDRIGTVVSGVTNYPVIIEFDTNASEILPNMAATANIIVDSKSNVMVVPSDAITSQADGSNTVQVLRNGTPVDVTVEVGLTSDTQTEIISGLNVGDEVITGTSSGTSGTSTSTSPFNTFRVGGAGGNVRVGR